MKWLKAVACVGALALVVFAEPLGAWLDEHYPIGGAR